MNTTLKRFTIFLVLILSIITANSQKLLGHQTPSLKSDSIPVLSNYQVQLINLNFNSMMYWYQTANALDTLYQLEAEKVKLYSRITGIQTNNTDALMQAYENKRAIDLAIKTENEMLIKTLKKENRGLRVKTALLTISTTGLLLTTFYFAIL